MVKKSENNSITSLKNSFRCNDFIKKIYLTFFFNDYNIPIVFTFINDISATISRIDYVERNEPRSNFLIYSRTFFVFTANT